MKRGQTDIHTDIATLLKNRPMGQFFEKCHHHTCGGGGVYVGWLLREYRIYFFFNFTSSLNWLLIWLFLQIDSQFDSFSEFKVNLALSPNVLSSVYYISGQCGTNIRIFEYIRIYFDEYIHSSKYSLIFSKANIFGYSFVIYLRWRIYSDIHLSNIYDIKYI